MPLQRFIAFPPCAVVDVVVGLPFAPIDTSNVVLKSMKISICLWSVVFFPIPITPTFYACDQNVFVIFLNVAHKRVRFISLPFLAWNIGNTVKSTGLT